MLGRPWGAHGPTPAERWAAGRHVVTLAEREAFATSVACLEEEARVSQAAPAVAEATPAPAVTPEPMSLASVGAASAVDHLAPAATDAAAESLKPRAEAASRPHPAAPSGAEREGAEATRATRDEAARQRQAISRALVAHGYLLFTRRRIPLPITWEKVT
jgi:hypothetical protein